MSYPDEDMVFSDSPIYLLFRGKRGRHENTTAEIKSGRDRTGRHEKTVRPQRDRPHNWEFCTRLNCTNHW